MPHRKHPHSLPQDTVLFNDTILHNIRYGNLSATDEEVYEAARMACIHEAITTRFPKVSYLSRASMSGLCTSLLMCSCVVRALEYY